MSIILKLWYWVSFRALWKAYWPSASYMDSQQSKGEEASGNNPCLRPWALQNMAWFRILSTICRGTNGTWFMVELSWSSILYKGENDLILPKLCLGSVMLLTIFSAMHVMQVQKERNRDTGKPLLGLLPYFTTWTFVPLYLRLQPVVLEHHLIPFVFYVGLINAYSVGQIITAHLTKNPVFPMYNVLTIPIGLAVLDSLGPQLGFWPSALGDGTYQIAFVFLCLGLGIGVYGSFIVSKWWRWGW